MTSMAYRQVDPAELEGDELRRWYLRTPDEIDSERAQKEQARRDTFFGVGRVEEVRYLPPPAPVVVRPAPETRAAYPPGAPRNVGAPGSFFGSYAPLPQSNTYVQKLPTPLDRVEQTLPMPGMYQLSDGTMVSGPEVDRIYAEQKRRMAGADSPEPKVRVRTVNRLKDGQIPLAAQIEKGERELDPTCHPNGGWEHDPGFDKRSERSRRYETQITRNTGLDYVVRNLGEAPVKFDGCAVWDPRRELLEAKGPGYGSLIEEGKKYGFVDPMIDAAESQGDRQVSAAKGRPIDWHIAEPRALKFFEDSIPSRERIRFIYTPAR